MDIFGFSAHRFVRDLVCLFSEAEVWNADATYVGGFGQNQSTRERSRGNAEVGKWSCLAFHRSRSFVLHRLPTLKKFQSALRLMVSVQTFGGRWGGKNCFEFSLTGWCGTQVRNEVTVPYLSVAQSNLHLIITMLILVLLWLLLTSSKRIKVFAFICLVGIRLYYLATTCAPRAVLGDMRLSADQANRSAVCMVHVPNGGNFSSGMLWWSDDVWLSVMELIQMCQASTYSIVSASQVPLPSDQSRCDFRSAVGDMWASM